MRDEGAGIGCDDSYNSKAAFEFVHTVWSSQPQEGLEQFAVHEEGCRGTNISAELCCGSKALVRRCISRNRKQRAESRYSCSLHALKNSLMYCKCENQEYYHLPHRPLWAAYKDHKQSGFSVCKESLPATGHCPQNVKW